MQESVSLNFAQYQKSAILNQTSTSRDSQGHHEPHTLKGPSNLPTFPPSYFPTFARSAAIQEQLLRSIEKQFQEGLLFKARRLLYHSTPGPE